MTEVSSWVIKSMVESTSVGLKRTSCEVRGMLGPLTGGTRFIIVIWGGDYFRIIRNLKDLQDVFLHFSLLFSPCFKGMWRRQRICVATLTTVPKIKSKTDDYLSSRSCHDICNRMSYCSSSRRDNRYCHNVFLLARISELFSPNWSRINYFPKSRNKWDKSLDPYLEGN